MDYYQGLLNSLKRGVISPVYLFYGEEAYLKEQALLAFKSHFSGDIEAEFNFDLIEGETATAVEIVRSAETIPFFSEKRIVVVKNPVFFRSAKRGGDEIPGEEDQDKDTDLEKPLLDYLKDPLSSTCLIFTTGEPVDKRKRLYKAIKNFGGAVEFSFLSRAELAGWLVKEARKEGKSFAAGAQYALVEAAGPALQNLTVELEKIMNYLAGQDTITKKDIYQVCSPVLEENIFAVVDAIGNKDCPAALNGIREMLAAKAPPPRILSMISRQFRLLLLVKDMLERGFKPGEITARLKLKPFVYQKIVSQSKNFSLPLLAGIFQSLSEIDASLKTGRQEFYPAVEIFLLKLCARRAKRQPRQKI